MRRRIWIDTDVALGASRGDVDDGFAVAAIARAAELDPAGVEVLGISAVSGNTTGEIALRSAEALARELGLRVPVVPERDAPAALAALPEGASVLAIGPPTNLAKAAALDPSWPSRVAVRAVGTVLDRRRHPILPLFCLNFRTDPAASRRFFALPFAQRIVFPLDVVRELRFGARELDAIACASLSGAYLARHARRWLRQAPIRYLDLAFPVWDLVAALDAIGRLPGARYTGDGGKLRAFDARAAIRGFLELMRN